jgi:hypothetical protein
MDRPATDQNTQQSSLCHSGDRGCYGTVGIFVIAVSSRNCFPLSGIRVGDKSAVVLHVPEAGVISDGAIAVVMMSLLSECAVFLSFVARWLVGVGAGLVAQRSVAHLGWIGLGTRHDG